MEVVVRRNPPFTTREYRTPLGTVSEKVKFDPKQGVIIEQQVEYLFKSEKDYPVLEYVIEHTTLDRVTIWGGVPSQFFLPEYSDEEFDACLINLFREVAPGYNFIVGMGENLPFNGKIERVGRIAELIDKYGVLPISI